jgi:ATP-binding cassette subfamily B protein
MQALERLAQGKTTFLVTHVLRQAARSNLIVYVENGCILERGTHAKLIRSRGSYAAMYKLQEGTGENDSGVRKEVANAVTS